VPLSSYRMVRARELEKLIERMRINVPSSIRESERTLAERDRILYDAQVEAERIIQQAKQQAMEILSERSLMSAAQQEAQRIIDESKEIARRRTDEADGYAVHVLEELAGRLQNTLQQVENGIQLLQNPPVEEAPLPEERSVPKRFKTQKS
jgi:F0F1-type ATP synthase membrane subunit b/b'